MCSRWENEPELRIAAFGQSSLVLNRDQFFPGYCFLVAREHATELFHLEQGARQELLEEVSRAAAALAGCFRPTKMNYELIGNMVPHIHWHLVPRFAADPLWPRPIWSEPHQEVILAPAEYAERIAMIREALAGTS